MRVEKEALPVVSPPVVKKEAPPVVEKEVEVNAGIAGLLLISWVLEQPGNAPGKLFASHQEASESKFGTRGPVSAYTFSRRCECAEIRSLWVFCVFEIFAD